LCPDFTATSDAGDIPAPPSPCRNNRCLDKCRLNGDAAVMKASARTRTSRRFDSPEQETFLNLWRTYDCLKAVETDLFDQFQLSAQQYNALRLLRAVHPGSLQTLALGKRLISRGPDTTRMLDRLEQRQLIRRDRRMENRRVVEIAITDDGIALLEQMSEPVRAMHRLQLGHLNRAEQQELIALLKRIRQPHEDSSCDWLDE
jgi:DNA-binding MarR family transcriptional regulator